MLNNELHSKLTVHTWNEASLPTSEYKVAYKYDTTTKGYIHQAEATLTISSTMEVHSGTYSCLVKLVDFSQSKSVSSHIIYMSNLYIIRHCYGLLDKVYYKWDFCESYPLALNKLVSHKNLFTNTSATSNPFPPETYD